MMVDKDRTLPFLDKVVWVVGASSGIGEQLSRQLSGLGASLILSARREEKLNKINENLPRNPGVAKVLPLDLEDLAQLPQKVEDALSYYGRVDYLINNAGVAIRDFALATNLEVDQKLMNINYYGPVVITKHLLPHMFQEGHGHIMVTSSLSGKYGVPRTAAYAASKHALHGFFETLRSETVDRGIDITIIVPGIIQTEITAHAVVGDGGNFGRVETTFLTAYPAEKAARKMITAILKRKEEKFVGGSERITLWLNRISPWLLRRLVRNHPLKKFRRLKQRFSMTKKEPA